MLSIFVKFVLQILLLCSHAGSRMLRVWSREGVLSSTSETVDGLEQALFWK